MDKDIRTGVHALLDAYKCDPEKLNDEEYLMLTLQTAASLIGTIVLKADSHRYDPHGISVSFQFLMRDHNHQVVEDFFILLNREHDVREVDTQCSVISSVASYNFPKYWLLEVGGELVRAISFSWMHQGMGEKGKQHRLRASLVRGDTNVYAYLRDSEHYLIPKDLV